MLDPTVTWMRCPDCPQPPPSLPRVQECLAEVLLRKVLKEISVERQAADWCYGTLDEQAACYYLDEIALVQEHRDKDDGWMLISKAGVMKNLTVGDYLYHLERAGIHPPRS